MRAYVFILTFSLAMAAVAAQTAAPQDRDAARQREEGRTRPATYRRTR